MLTFASSSFFSDREETFAWYTGSSGYYLVKYLYTTIVTNPSAGKGMIVKRPCPSQVAIASSN